MTIHKCQVCSGDIRRDRYPKTYCSKKCQAEVEGWSDETLRKRNIEKAIKEASKFSPPELEPILTVTNSFPTAIFSDIHAPYQDEKWLNIAMDASIRLGCTKLIVNGDFINAATIGRHNGLRFKRGEILENDFRAGEILMEMFSRAFDEVIFLSGNHCLDRLEKLCSGEISPQRLWKMFGDHKNVRLSSKQFVYLNGHTMVCHQRMFSKARGNVSQKLANRHQMHVITAHEHHSAKTYSECGKFQAVACPCLMDLSLSDYTNDSATLFPEHMNGFAVAFDKRIEVFDKFTNWKLMGLPEYI